MSKSLAASQKVMRSYLSELLTDDEVSKPVKEPDTKPLEKLLEGVSKTQELPVKTEVKTTKSKQPKPVVKTKAKVADPVKEKVKVEEKESELTPLKTRKSEGARALSAKAKDYREGSFQAMFFDVAGLTIAVPLIELGGIYNAEKTTPLMGKPDWFSGVMLHRDEKVNVVNTARWVMPEKCTPELLDGLDYQYIIMLGTSGWGFSAEQLVDTVTLNQDDVKWLDDKNKRPWLAGLVKDRMCALLDVDSLIRLLDDGAGIHQN